MGLPRLRGGAGDPPICSLDTISRFVGRNVLPETQDVPASLGELTIGVGVSSLVALDLPPPPVAVGSRPDVVLRAPVPEAPVDVDRQTYAGESNVDRATVVPGHLELHAVAQATAMQFSPQSDFRRSVAPSEPRHLDGQRSPWADPVRFRVAHIPSRTPLGTGATTPTSRGILLRGRAHRDAWRSHRASRRLQLVHSGSGATDYSGGASAKPVAFSREIKSSRHDARP